VHIAQLQATHAAPYRSLMLEAYELAADAFTTTAAERAAQPESFWVKRIADPSGLSVAMGAFEGEALVGTVALELSAKPKTLHKGLVIGMYCAPSVRGRGVGRALLDGIVAQARARDGLKLLTLTVTEGNEPALHLYRSVGFETFGVEPMAILTPSGYQGKVHMWLALGGASEVAAPKRRQA
jgi:ribosomal protein S18 acetylase RimI-like enzyme